MIESIQFGEWVILVIFGLAMIACACGIFLLEGDLRVKHGINTGDVATAIFIDLLNEAKETINIHDDGNDFEESLYNDDEVIDATKDCLKRNVRIRCLFNDDEPLQIKELAQSGDYGDLFQIWHMKDGRQVPDTHYKIVDKGRFVYLTRHKRGDIGRKYRLHSPKKRWETGARARISKPYSDHFENGLKRAVQAA